MELDYDKYIEQLQSSLKDVGEFLTPEDLDIFLSQAVLVYSKKRPLIKIHEANGDGVTFDYPLPEDWVLNFSYLNSPIQYPADDTIQQINTLDSNDWQFFKKLVSTVTTTFIRFKTFIPASGNKIRFEYANPHILSNDDNTIQDADSTAVISLAAAICYWALAARFAQHSDSTIEADVIDYARKADTYSNLAKEKISMYNSLMGIGTEGSKMAAATAGVSVRDLDITYPPGLGDYLTHPSSIR